MPNLTPEQRARETIDAMLAASGWAVQSKDAVNLSASRGVAICELSFATGAPDYTLFVDGRAIGTVEAKPEGVTLTSAEAQSAKYVAGVPLGLSLVGLGNLKTLLRKAQSALATLGGSGVTLMLPEKTSP